MHSRRPIALLGFLAFLPTTIACGSDEGAGDVTDEADLTSANGLVCTPPPACDAPPPKTAAESFEHVSSQVVASTLTARHRGRDLFVTPGQPITAIAKFAYGTGTDKDLKDENVHVYLDKGCAGSWSDLGVFRTSTDGKYATVEGVEDTGGRIYLKLPALPQGRHRVHFAVPGDGTSTDAFIEVLKAGTKIIVSDVDGTLTTSENVEFVSLLTGAVSEANPHAAEALQAAVKKGYRPFYLTARPEWLVGRTREFLKERGFPEGIVHTTLGLTGAFNDAAAAFKSDELNGVTKKGLRLWYAVGNRASDATAFTGAGVPKDRAFLYQFTDDVHGCVRVDDYATLATQFGKLPVCK